MPQPTTTSSLDRITFDFGAALVHLKRGRKVTRTGWNGKGMWIALNEGSPVPSFGGVIVSLPFLYMCTVTGDLVPWQASHTDLLAEDWVLVH